MISRLAVAGLPCRSFAHILEGDDALHEAYIVVNTIGHLLCFYDVLLPDHLVLEDVWLDLRDIIEAEVHPSLLYGSPTDEDQVEVKKISEGGRGGEVSLDGDDHRIQGSLCISRFRRN